MMPGSPASRVTLSNQRAFVDRRVSTPTPTSQPNPNPGVVSSRFKPGNLSVFGEGDTSTPSLLDLSEFPTLRARGAGDQAQAAPLPPKPYVGLLKQPTPEQVEFSMTSEDFPALPGTATWGMAPARNLQAAPLLQAGDQVPESSNHNLNILSTEKTHNQKALPTIHTSSEGKVTNIPETMIPNQFGIAGLLAFTREAESNPDLVSLALGEDLTALGLNLNSPDNLYATFTGPWSERACGPKDIDYHVPPEYRINGAVREKLAPIRLNRYKEDVLFYIFYSFVNDAMQTAAAAELYNRDWRYHMEEKVWISQAPGMPMVEKTATYERGIYYFFDAETWRKVPKEFRLEYVKLEGRPQLPSHNMFM